MKKIVSVLLCLAMLGGTLFAFSACNSAPVLNVCNWGEYISDGAEGSLNVIKRFEEQTGIRVKYTTFTTNEALYAKLAGGGVNYDVIIPSDYLIERLIEEERLEKIDFSKIPNYKYILPEYKQLYFDPQGAYSVPYTVGMVGVIYNTKLVNGTPDSLSAMWDPAYKGQILQFESPRDAFGTAQFLLGQDINTTNEADWRAAADKLKEQAPLIQSYVSDEIYEIMEGENAIIGPYYAGDYILMRENNPDLGFFYPKEGTNYFYDSMCVPKGAVHYDAAMQFINFMLETEIAMANAEYIKYASPHTGVINHPDYKYRGEEILYPAPESMPVIQNFKHLPQETLTLMNNLWTEVKGVK